MSAETVRPVVEPMPDATAPPPTGHVIVCGLRGIGLRIVEQLYRSGEAVTVLEEYADPLSLAVVTAWSRSPAPDGLPIDAAVHPPGVTTVAPFGSSGHTLTVAGIFEARAVVCVVDDELTNLEISLVARELRPDVRIVTQLGNQAIGRAMAADNGPGAVLDVAALATPAIVEACLSRRVHEIPIGAQTFVVATVPVERASTLRGLYGDLAPIAVVRPARQDGEPTLVVDCPGRDFEVVPGDFAAMLGTAADFETHGVDVRHPNNQDADPRRTSLVSRWLSVLTGVLKDFDPGFYRAGATVLCLVSISTVLLWLTYKKPGMSVLDALYFSTETVATVGYGDFNFIDQEPFLRVWAIFLMVAGVTTIAMLMAFLSDMLISRRLNGSIGRRKVSGMAGHVVVVGLGSFGIRVAGALAEAGEQVVIVERDPNNRYLSEAQELNLPVIFGDATLRPTLDAARVAASSAVAVLTSNDMVNIETAIAVRDLFGLSWSRAGGVPVVTRVFDRALGRTIARRFGFHNVQSTEELTAPWFVGAALGLDVLGSFSVAQQTFMVSRLTVEAGSSLAGLAMNELSANTRVVALTRQSTGVMEHPPRRGTVFAAGDLAYLVGPYEELLGVLRRARLR